MTKFLGPVLRIVQIIFVIFLIFFAVRILRYHWGLVTFPYANTLREGAMMTSTDALVKGLNPFDMSLQPWIMNQYGIVYPLLVWPWAKLFGTTILVHRIVSAFFVLASCFLLSLVLKRMTIPVLLSFWAVLMFYASLMYPVTSTSTIDPGATGLFFFLLTIFIPWFFEYSYPSLILSVLFGIIALYTKLYFFLGVFMLLPFLFIFVSKIKGVFYGLSLLAILTISIIVVNQILPAYFDNCFFSSINMGPSWSSMERLHEQIVMYSDLHQWIFILMGLYILGYAVLFIRKNSWGIIKSGAKNVFLSFRLNRFKEPLIKLRFPLFLFTAFCSSFVLYFSLGRHGGAMLWYFFQLLSPFLLIGAVWLFSRNAYWPILCIPLLVLTLYKMTSEEDPKWFSKNLTGWPEVSMLVSQHQNILNSSLIAPLLIEQHKRVYDDGQAEYFVPGGERNDWMKGLFKEDDRVFMQQFLFFNDLRSMVENKQFDLIILQPSLLPLGVGDDIKKYYKFEGQLLVWAPQDRRPYAVTVWVPLKDS